MAIHANSIPAPSNNVFELSPPYAKTLPRGDAGKFLLTIRAYTDLIGGPVTKRDYAIEDLLVDPDAELEDGCLIVGQFKGGALHMMGYEGCTGRDHRGRFVPAGHPDECYTLSWGLRIARSEKLRIFRIIGRVVGERRRFPIMG